MFKDLWIFLKTKFDSEEYYGAGHDLMVFADFMD